VVRLNLGLEDQALEVEPETGVEDRKLADLPALSEDRQPFAVVVEVLELNALQRALAQPVVEQEPQCQLVSDVVVGGEDRASVVTCERRP